MGGNERYLDPVWSEPFWKQPENTWKEFLHAGPYAFWLCAHAAARIMEERHSGLIAAVSEPIVQGFEGQQPPLAQTFGHLAHYAVNRLVADLARDAGRFGIAVTGLLPGFMRTERVEMHLPDEASRKMFRYHLSESPEYCGRAIAALAAHPKKAMKKSGRMSFVADLAYEFGFTDIDGKRVANFYQTAQETEPDGH